MESMVQRVVRQIRETKITDAITIATNATQMDIIINQLGDDISVVTEPERRDTFPAIALAASYLKYVRHCDDDEAVVIMPCDPYTETGYFETIRKMSECVKANVADLILMGITPTYPSSKYGYVVPVMNNASCVPANYLQVSRFTEKPSVETAEELLRQHALWNGGVFSFRLGYMMNIVRKYIDSDSFEDTRKRYSELPKISFDYEVAEKAKSVAVVPYTGEWKDLGTWNSLCEELRHDTVGNVIMGDKNENTLVVNELRIPIFCNGLKNTIVAASHDGIMVCDKQETEQIKDYVGELQHRSLYGEHRWGICQILDDSKYDDGYQSLTKKITLKAGNKIGSKLRLHLNKIVTCINGEGLLVLDNECRHVKSGDVMNLPPEHHYALKAITDLTFIEVQIGDMPIEEDYD